MTKNEILEFLIDKKSYLAEQFNVSKIGIFGSFARDESRDSSDIDIIVSMPPSFDGYYALKEFLEESLNRKIDLGLEENIRSLVKDKIKDEIIYV